MPNSSIKSLRMLLVLMMLIPGLVQAYVVVMAAAKDNSIYEEDDSSNGAGSYLFAGKTGPSNNLNDRRALIQFDIASAIPAGSTIDTVELELHVTRVPAGDETQSRIFNLHRINVDWGEGSSDAPDTEGRGGDPAIGDATWNYAFYPTVEWTFEGGDFQFNASASTPVSIIGGYFWTSDTMKDDVQAWLDDPAGNFGWILIGPATDRTARRFASRENGIAENRPALHVTFTPPTHWAGYLIMDDFRTVDTGDYLGYIDIANRPWIYVYSLEQWIYLPEDHVTGSGAWGYIPK